MKNVRKINICRPTNIKDTVDDKILRWYGHVGNGTRPKKLLEWVPPERRKRGRRRKTWMKGIRNAMTRINLKYDDWKGQRRGVGT